MLDAIDYNKLICDWSLTIGLRVICVSCFELSDLDDLAFFTILVFDNGKFIIQRDQTSWTTSCGLLDATEAARHEIHIHRAMAAAFEDND